MTTELEIGGVQIKLLRYAQALSQEIFEIHVLSNGKGKLVEEFKKIDGVIFHELPSLRKKPHPWWDLRAFIELVLILRSIKLDILDYTGPKSALLGSAASALVRVPVRIYTMGGMLFNPLQKFYSRWIFKGLEKILCRLSTVVINVCRVNRDKLIFNYIITPDKSEVVYSPSPIGKFIEASQMDKVALRLAKGFDKNHFIVLQVSNLIPLKNNIAILCMAKDLITQFPNMQFVLVGDGEDRPKLEAYIQNHHLSDNCRLLGWRDDVPELMAMADVVTLTTKYQEGLPQVCTQAMAAAKPVVAYDWEGIKEDVVNGYNGFLIPMDHDKLFKSRLVELYQNSDMAIAMGRKGQKMVNLNHEINFVVERMTQLYQKRFLGTKK